MNESHPSASTGGQSQQGRTLGSAQPGPARIAPAPAGPPKIAPIPNVKPAEVELDPIGLVDEVAQEAGEKKIKTFGIVGGQRIQQWKREPHKTGTGAIRVRSFHGKLSEQGMEYLDNAVNEWIDQHPEVEVKFVTSSVGVFEGKIREPALILNVWY